ncbi:MAG: hypothetical protein A2066_13550 [Bacteroidetes bacterium GWB2_41_8]|nr:MAG: hypothetical protein A2066_13550 [Bacteroidetes bacterium GWB2_41_8]
MQNRKQKTWKILSIILLSMTLIIFAVLGLLFFKAQSYLNDNLSGFVSKKSKGKYELNFSNLDINFRHWGFEIEQLAFHPSDSIIRTLNDTIQGKQLYSFSSPNVRFGQIKLLKLIFNKQLEIGEILITQPELNIHGKQEDTDNEKNSISSVLQELKPLVSKTFKYIKINKIELVNASFDFYNLLGDTRKLANAENITIGILDFYTDSLLLPDPTKLFDASDIYLRMASYQNRLGDSIHTLTAQTVTYSLKKSQIEAENIELKPTNQTVTATSKYEISIPKALIKSSHINEFYGNFIIPIDSMVLSNAKIKFWPGRKSTRTVLKTIDDFDLYELIKDDLSSVSVSNFRLENAQLMLYRDQADLSSQQELKNIHLNLEDFLLDSVSSQDTSRIFYARNIDFSASGYELTLGDNIHRLKVGQLDISTKRKAVFIKNILLYPLLTDQGRITQKNTIDGSCDSVRLDLFEFKKAFHTKRFYFQRINIFNPEVQLTQNKVNEQKEEPENASFVYQLISVYLKGIYSNQVSVQRGKFKLQNKTGVLQKGNIETSVKLFLSGFALDELSAGRSDRLFFANHIELNFSDYKMQLVDQLHKLTVENFFLSTRQKHASIQNLHLFPDSKENIEELLKQYNRSELYEFTIPELAFDSADFHQAFFRKRFFADRLSIKTPTIYYENFAQLKPTKPKANFEDLYLLISNYLEDIHFGKVEIPDGTIRLINHSKNDKTISLNNQFTLELENTVINKDQFGLNKLLFSEQVDFSVRDHLIRLSDNVHVIKAGTVGFSTARKEIYVTNARMYPETNSQKFTSINWNIQLSIPELRIRGISIADLYFNQKIDAENLLISSPEIKLYQKNKSKDPTEFKEVSLPLPKEIESISIGKFNLNSGSLKIFSEFGLQPYLLVQSDLKMESQNIVIKKNPLTSQPEFKSGKYSAGFFQFKFTPKDKNQQISIEELNFSTSEKQIKAKQLTVSPKTKSTKQDQFELRIPSLSMNGFDIDNAYRFDRYLFESILVEKPVFQLYNNAADSVQINPFRVNLYPHFESFADVFATKSLKVNDADLTIFKNGKQKMKEKITFDLTNFRIDNLPSKGFLHSTDFSFRIQNTKHQDKKKLYQFAIGSSEYSSKNNRFVARDLRLIPNFSKEKFNKQNSFQSDYYEGKLDSVVIAQPNIRRWFDKGELAGKYMSVNGLDMDIYRDKRLPFDEKRRPEMLQDMIKSMPYPVQIDSLKLNNAKIKYSEQPEQGEQAGQISFSRINVVMKPFTNIKGAGLKYQDFGFTGTASIMDSCQLNVSMNYQMNHPDNLFTASGNLSPFNMRILNPVLEPLSLVSIRTGHVDQFNFYFSADRNQANGQLFFGYNDLRISLFAMKDGNTKEAKFASFLANSLMLRSKNPRGKELLPDEISFKRDEKRSVLNYWWKSIFSGIRNTLGIKENSSDSK